MKRNYHEIPGILCDVWIESHIKHGEGRRCGRGADEDIFGKIYVCHVHKKQLGRFMDGKYHDRIKLLEEELEDANARAAANEIEHEMRRQDWIERQKARTRKRQLVYFIRCEAYVKIGVSASPEGRLRDLQRSGNGTLAPPRIDLTTAELVATEPGGLKRERKLHGMFNYLRQEGEWFLEEDEITEYIENLLIDKIA